MSAAEKLIERLHNVKQLRPGSWAAGCPCCQSKRGRPVHVRDNSDKVLVNAFCGCQTTDVLTALGLTLGDLFDRPLSHSAGPTQARISARELLAVIDADVTTATEIIGKVRMRQAVTLDEWNRLTAAVATIQRAQDHAHAR